MTPNIVHGLEGVPGTEARPYHNVKESIYCLPTDADENERLEKQHQMILELFNGPLASEEAHEALRNGGSVLDVGCGPGSWIKHMAGLYPQAKAHATDFAPTFQPDSSLNVTFVPGNVVKGLPYEDASFDVVQMRFFLAALKREEWPIAIKELHRVVKPGGWVQLIEPWGQLRCREGHSEIIEDWNKRGTYAAITKRGGDPIVGQRLESLLKDASFSSTSVKTATIPFDASNALSVILETNARAIVKTLAPVLSQSLDMTTDEVVAWGERVLEECHERDACSTYVCAVGRR